MFYKHIINNEAQRSLHYLKDILAFPSISAQSKHKQDLISCKDWLMSYCRDIGFPSVEYLQAATLRIFKVLGFEKLDIACFKLVVYSKD